MSRYRPPMPKSSPYITLAGRQKLTAELRYLGEELRPEVTKALGEAAAEGDRSENAEYIYRKKQLREIDRRLRYLVKRLEVLKTVDRPPQDTSKVFFGAHVTLLTEDDAKVSYRLVGADEIDTKQGLISIDSPLARALLKQSVGDEVTVQLPDGEAFYEILDIRYEA